MGLRRPAGPRAFYSERVQWEQVLNAKSGTFSKGIHCWPSFRWSCRVADNPSPGQVTAVQDCYHLGGHLHCAQHVRSSLRWWSVQCWRPEGCCPRRNHHHRVGCGWWQEQSIQQRRKCQPQVHVHAGTPSPTSHTPHCTQVCTHKYTHTHTHPVLCLYWKW